MTAAPPLLDVQALSKSYAGTRVVDGVSLAIAPGECLGVIGPNGAGKTTTIRMCLGLTAPDSGGIRYFTQPDGTALEMPRDGLAIKARLGVVSQFDSLDPDFSCAENLFVFGRYFGLTRSQMAERVPQLLDFAALGHKADAKPAELSGGMKRRLSLARALVTDPEILLMDEPFAALDEITRERLNDDLLRWAAALQLTTVFVTHSVFEAVYLSRRVVVMSPRPGRIVGELEIDEPWPRDDAFRGTRRFAEMAARLSRMLRGAEAAA